MLKALLLFDIDGTLIDTEGAGLVSLEEGLFKAFPDRRHLDFPPLDLGGATDGSVVTFLFDHFEIEDHSQNRKVFFDTYSVSLDERLHSFREAGKGRALPGVAKLLEELSSGHRHLALGLLTGNTEEGARIKLRHFQLEEHFEFGAFGDDHHDRNRLGPIALKRAMSATGHRFSPESVVIIGDTRKDIACARAFGAKVVAVATGTERKEDLSAANPDVLLDDLSDLPQTIAAVESAISCEKGS